VAHGLLRSFWILLRTTLTRRVKLKLQTKQKNKLSPGSSRAL
jgi:hypothetical protein